MVKKSLVLLLLSMAGFAPLWAQETVVWELVTDYSNLSTSDTYVIAGNGISSLGKGTTVCSLKNHQVSTANYLPIGKTIATYVNQNVYTFDDIIINTFDSDDTWTLEKVSGNSGIYYIKSTRGSLYLQYGDGSKSKITSKPTSTSNDGYRQWKIHLEGTNSSGEKVTGLYNVKAERMLALEYTSSATNWRAQTSSYYGDFMGAEVVLYRKVTSVPVSVSAVKYASFCSSCPLDFTGTGITAYKAKSDGSKVVLTAIADGIVPAKTGVVLCSPEAITFNVPVTAATGSTDWTDNELVGITERTSVSINGDEGKTNYIFANENDRIGFYLAAADGAYLGANRAYLSTATTATAPYLGFDDDETTDIDLTTVSGQRVTDNAYYDLSGRRVVQPTRGLYIVNGKKVVIK